MKNNLPAVVLPALMVSIVFLFSSCLKDNCTRTYKIYTPVYEKLSDLRTTVASKSAASVVNRGKLYIKDKYIFLNEQNKGIHVIDNSNPANPTKVSFINIPGNIDMYVKGNTMYADLYCDFVAIDISNPQQVAVKKFLTNTFPDKSEYTNSTNPDSIKVITSWLSRDTTVDCSDENRLLNSCMNCSLASSSAPQSSSSAGKADAGMAGSMARFAAVNNYMYAVTTHDLNVIDIAETNNPILVKKYGIGWDVETIFPYNNKLYIGAGSSMSVYDLQDPVNPVRSSWNGHWCSNDPVVVEGKYAYVTLHEADFCNSKINQLEVYDISTAGNALLVKTYPMTGPQGLSKDGNLLFICDNGLKIFDASNVSDIKLLKHITGIKTYDVIADNGTAYVVAKEGLYQYNYSNLTNVRLISKF